VRTGFWGIFLALSVALAAGVKTRLVLPPLNLPQGTQLHLLDSSGKSLWESGQPLRAATLERAAYLEFALPGGKTYTYQVEHPKGMAGRLLETLRVRLGKHSYALITLLENRKLELGKDGTLVGQ
jgi:hypothetical protein